MKYVSTRGSAARLSFCDTVMTGLAPDGGLYLPEFFPHLSPSTLRSLRGCSYQTIAKAVMWPFIGSEIERHDFEQMVDEAYSTFHHPAICPLIQTNTNEFILELFHGPTLAFKDVAMQFLARIIDYILQKRQRRATIIGATSGDTGGAAIEAFGGRDNTDIFILFPKGRVSTVQQKFMTTNNNGNVFVLAVDGTFDDCQALVKAMFNDHAFSTKTSLTGVNSINWARIMAQIVYYFTAALTLGAPDRAISFTVPTGNFGDIFAGFVAVRMGLPIAHLVIATNENDILVRALNTGRYAMEQIAQTTSPSMDIQISSNFERLLFESGDREPELVIAAMNNLQISGQFDISEPALGAMRSLFLAGRSTMEETAATIDDLYRRCGYLADPHTAIGVKVGRENSERHVPMAILATAHPAKFPETVAAATTITPALPRRIEEALKKPETFEIVPNDIRAVKEYILARTRASC